MEHSTPFPIQIEGWFESNDLEIEVILELFTE